MTTRFDVERALEDSDLPPTARHIVLVLCGRMELGSIRIPPRYSPSLNRLAHATGRNRRTIIRNLGRLEQAGWLYRRRAAGRTTVYAIRIPDPQPEASGPSTGDMASRDLVASGPSASDTAPPIQIKPDRDQEIDLIIEELKKRTGRTIDPDWAVKARDLILARPGAINNRIGYLRRVLTTDPNPDRFLPTSQPPRFTREKGFTP